VGIPVGSSGSAVGVAAAKERQDDLACPFVFFGEGCSANLALFSVKMIAGCMRQFKMID